MCVRASAVPSIYQDESMITANRPTKHTHPSNKSQQTERLLSFPGHCIMSGRNDFVAALRSVAGPRAGTHRSAGDAAVQGHNVGHVYRAKPPLTAFYRSLDPCNRFNPGIGQGR